METGCGIINYLPDNLKQLELYKKIDDLFCYSRNDSSKDEILNFIETLDLSLIFRKKLQPDKFIINWFSRLQWNETKNADWERFYIFEDNQLNFNEFNYEDSLTSVYSKLINSKNRNFNNEGFKFWAPSLKPYIGTNLIQRKMIEILELDPGKYKYEFNKIQFYIGNLIYDAFIKDGKFDFRINKNIVDEALNNGNIEMKIHYYNGLRNALEIKKLGHINRYEIKIEQIEIGSIRFLNINFNGDDNGEIKIQGFVEVGKRPYTQLAGIVDWYENNLPINTYDILLNEFPGESKAQALISASLEYKNIESKLFTIKDNLCVSRMGLSDGSKLNSEKISDIYGSDFMGVKICFQRYETFYLDFLEDFKFEKIINSESSRNISIWCESTLSNNYWLDRGIPEGNDPGDGVVVPEFRICPKFIRQTYETQRSQFNQLLPAYNFVSDFWSASTTWEDTFNWVGVIIDRLVSKTIGPDKNISWINIEWKSKYNWSSYERLGQILTGYYNYENTITWELDKWVSDLNWGAIKVDGGFVNRLAHENVSINWDESKTWGNSYVWVGKINSYHYNKPYQGDLPDVRPGQVDWGWPDTGLDKYPINIQSGLSLYKVLINKTKTCETDDGYGRILDGKFALVDGNLTSECDYQDGNLLYEDREYNPYLNNPDKKMLISNSAFISEEWYISGNFNSGRPYAEESINTSINNVTKFNSFSKHSIEMIFGEENSEVKNIIMSQDSLIDDELYLSGDVSDGIRPIANINYHKKLLKYNSGVIYSTQESEFMPQTDNATNRNVIMSQDAVFGEKLYLSGISLDLSIYLVNTYNKEFIHQREYEIVSNHATEWMRNKLQDNIYNENLLSVDSQFTFNKLGGEDNLIIHDKINGSIQNLNNNNFKVYDKNTEFIYPNILLDNTDENIILGDDSQIGINDISGAEN